MRTLILALLTALAWSSSPFAEEGPGEAPVDPKFAAGVARMEQTLRTLPSYSVAVKLDWKGDGGDVGATHFTFQFERPARFRIEIRQAEGKGPTLIAVADGTNLTTYLPASKLYTLAPLANPAHLVEVDPFLASTLKGSLIDSLMRTDLKSYILARTRDVKHLGEDRLDGQAVDHFQLVWGLDDEEFWIGPEAQALPRKVIRVTKYTDEAGANAGAVLKLTMTTTLSWTVGKPIAPGTFALEPPADAKLVDDLEAALQPNSAP